MLSQISRFLSPGITRIPNRILLDREFSGANGIPGNVRRVETPQPQSRRVEALRSEIVLGKPESFRNTLHFRRETT